MKWCITFVATESIIVIEKTKRSFILVSDLVRKSGQRFFFTINKKLQKAKRKKKTEVCLSNQQSFGLFGGEIFVSS